MEKMYRIWRKRNGMWLDMFCITLFSALKILISETPFQKNKDRKDINTSRSGPRGPGPATYSQVPHKRPPLIVFETFSNPATFVRTPVYQIVNFPSRNPQKVSTLSSYLNNELDICGKTLQKLLLAVMFIGAFCTCAGC